MAETYARRIKSLVHNSTMNSIYIQKSGYVRLPANSQEYQVAEAGETKINALDLLYSRTGGSGRIEGHCTRDQLVTIERESGCVDLPRYTCNAKQLEHPYRTLDGSCNNKQQFGQGAALTSFRRFLPSDYADGFNRPKGTDPRELFNGFPLPSARAVSHLRLSSKTEDKDNERNNFEMIWGQFIAHETGKTLSSSSIRSFSEGVLCNETCEYSAPCFPILVPKDDPRRSDKECLRFIRSSAACESGKARFTREQIDSVSAYIDASQVYGSLKEIGDNLWDNKTGELIDGVPSTFSPQGKPLLPVLGSIKVPGECMIRSEDTKCFAVGDTRANENILLLSLHNIWHREHNRLVNELTKLNPQWSGLHLYEEARKIVGAMIEKITFDEYFPNILGPKGAEMIGHYKGYNPKTSASITAEFSTAAFRFGHGTVGDTVTMLKDYASWAENITMADSFFNPSLINTKGLDVFIRGMVVTGKKVADPLQPLSNSVRENLFRAPNERRGMDLASLNVQRGRDHGLASYIHYVKKCGLGDITSWQDLNEIITDPEALNELQQLYGHPGNIDLFAGGLSETIVAGGRVGPTFRCIIAESMINVREGDRFWYENDQFSMDQLRELKKKVSPSRIICDNGDNIKFIPKDVMKRPSESNPIIPCNELPFLDLTPWKEKTHNDFSIPNLYEILKNPWTFFFPHTSEEPPATEQSEQHDSPSWNLKESPAAEQPERQDTPSRNSEEQSEQQDTIPWNLPEPPAAEQSKEQDIPSWNSEERSEQRKTIPWNLPEPQATEQSKQQDIPFLNSEKSPAGEQSKQQDTPSWNSEEPPAEEQSEQQVTIPGNLPEPSVAKHSKQQDTPSWILKEPPAAEQPKQQDTPYWNLEEQSEQQDTIPVNLPEPSIAEHSKQQDTPSWILKEPPAAEQPEWQVIPSWNLAEQSEQQDTIPWNSPEPPAAKQSKEQDKPSGTQRNPHHQNSLSSRIHPSRTQRNHD